jgi:anti-sigma regulatory factor (Ser/Thr protein kinase)
LGLLLRRPPLKSLFPPACRCILWGQIRPAGGESTGHLAVILGQDVECGGKMLYKLDVLQVKRLMLEQGYSAHKLAKALEIDVKTLRRWLNGEAAQIENVARLAEMLGTTPVELIVKETAAAPVTVQANPAPESLSRQRPVIQASLTLFDQWRVQADYFDPLKQALRAEFQWPESSATIAVCVLRELVENAFKHGCRGIGDLPVSFSVEASQGGAILTLTVNSPGPGFDFEALRAQGFNQDLLNEDKTSGRGLYLVSQNAKDLVGTADGRKIMAVMVRSHVREIFDGGLASVLDVDGHLIAIVKLPKSVCMHVFRLDQEWLSQVLDSEKAPLQGGIIDAMETLDADSPSLGVFVAINRMFRSRGMRFCIILNSTLNKWLQPEKSLGYHVSANLEEAIAYLLDDPKV